MRLSILICTMASRKRYLDRLLRVLNNQNKTGEVEILISKDKDSVSVGEKRNNLISKAVGEYICFVDDDDVVSVNYIPYILYAMKENPDVITFEGWMTTNGKFTANFVIKLGEEYKSRNGVYYRFPNHLAIIKRDIASGFKFKDVSFGEDYDWALRIKEANALKSSVHIKSKIYHYDYRTKK